MKREIVRATLLVAAVVASQAMAGCKPDVVHFTDSVDVEFDFAPVPPSPFDRPDYLHLPYVQGAEFYITAHRDHDRMSLWDAEPRSADPGVLKIIGHVENTDEWVSFKCRAVAPGTTEIIVYKNGLLEHEWGRADVEVRAPDNAKLFFSGPVLLGWPFADAEVRDAVNVLNGGTATFLIQLFDGEVRLNGHGAVDVQAGDADVKAVSRVTYFLEDRDWVQVTPSTEGKHEVDISSDGTKVATLEVSSVGDDAIDFIALDAASEKYADSGDTLAVLATGYTKDGEPIYGIEYDWYADGHKEYGEGDIYKYVYWHDGDTDLQAEYDGHTDETFIHAEEGWVTSSNRLGCSANGRGAAAPVAVAFTCLLLVLFALKAGFHHLPGRTWTYQRRNRASSS